jgi:hypothetical protein
LAQINQARVADPISAEFELALGSIETAIAPGDPFMSNIDYMQVYEPLRNDSSFQTMLKNMNLLP